MLRKCPRRRGTILVLALILMIVVFACVAFAIDVGYLSLLRTRLQVAADAGSMAATQALTEGATASMTAAKRFAELNCNRTDPLEIRVSEDVEFGTWDEQTRVFRRVTAANVADANAVRVTCRRTSARGRPANLFFAHLIGRKFADVSAVAVARAKTATCGRIIGLRRVTMSGTCYTDSYNSANGLYSAFPPNQRGHVCSNGPILTSGNTRINGNGHPGRGNSVIGSGTVTGNNSPLTEPLVFPPVDPSKAKVQNDNLRIPLTNRGSTAVVADNLTLAAGDSLDLPPGTYYFTNMTVSNGASLRTSGPTLIYVDGECNFSGGGIVNTTQKPSNLQMYCTGRTCTVSGTVDFHGVIYGPTTRIVRSGPSNIFGMLLGLEVNLSGNGGIHADEALGHLRGIPNRYAVLVY